MEIKTHNMTTMTIHQVVKVEVERNVQTSGTNVLRVLVHDEDGHRTEVTMFSDEKVEIEQGEPGE